MSRKKKIIICIIALLVVLLTIFCLYAQYLYMESKCMELSGESRWRDVVTYEMLSDKLKEVISEDELNDTTETGKYNLYCKLENLEIEKRRKHDYSTAYAKTPPCFEVIKADNGKFCVELYIDYRPHLTHIEVINIATNIYS